jgi:hypothetical protein
MPSRGTTDTSMVAVAPGAISRATPASTSSS